MPRVVLRAPVDVVGVQDLCDTPGAASAQNVTITENHRGVCEYRLTDRSYVHVPRSDQPTERLSVRSWLCCHGNRRSVRSSTCSGVLSTQVWINRA